MSSTDPLPALDLARLRAALAKMLEQHPQPWVAHRMTHFEDETGFLQAIEDANGDDVSSHFKHDGAKFAEFMGSYWETGQGIVAVVNAAPALIAHAARLAEIEKLRDRIQKAIYISEDGTYCQSVKHEELLTELLALLPAPPATERT